MLPTEQEINIKIKNIYDLIKVSKEMKTDDVMTYDLIYIDLFKKIIDIKYFNFKDSLNIINHNPFISYEIEKIESEIKKSIDFDLLISVFIFSVCKNINMSKVLFVKNISIFKNDITVSKFININNKNKLLYNYYLSFIKKSYNDLSNYKLLNYNYLYKILNIRNNINDEQKDIKFIFNFLDSFLKQPINKIIKCFKPKNKNKELILSDNGYITTIEDKL